MATPSPESSPSPTGSRRNWSELVRQARAQQHVSASLQVPDIDVRQLVQQQIMREVNLHQSMTHVASPSAWWEDVLNLFQWRWVPVAAAVTLAVSGYVGWTLRDVLDEMDLYAEVHQVLLLDL